jgi:hypothetical protein
MNAAYGRKIVSDELRETLMFCGLIEDFHCKTRVTEGRAHYRLDTKVGPMYVYSPRSFDINGEKAKSLNEVKYLLIKYL